MVRVTKIELVQTDVFQSEFRNRFLTGGHRTVCQVYAQEVTLWVIEGHGDQVAADTAAKLHDAAMVNRRWAHSPQDSNGSKPIRVGVHVNGLRI
jgi:hypothetical protein